MDAGLGRSKDLRFVQEELTKEQERFSYNERQINTYRAWSVREIQRELEAGLEQGFQPHNSVGLRPSLEQGFNPLHYPPPLFPMYESSGILEGFIRFLYRACIASPFHQKTSCFFATTSYGLLVQNFINFIFLLLAYQLGLWLRIVLNLTRKGIARSRLQ